MNLELRSLPAFIADENAHIPMRDGRTDWLVIVTREALEKCGCIDETTDVQLASLIPFFQAIAAYKLERGRTGEGATIRVAERDVLEWRSRHPG